ncbi:hypothetical protein [Synechococcus sp. RS9902]|uniref:hypothetical protein n=1 Tax=Synechococcus sp. RS9902 TaxID=221345 RepID=UPI0016466723|nr:hypothetical protein [Synechococcus sp. RS9902]QNI97969.1 hypothetical protein SynRS9902_02090 [Synechococcus sp. RS9902]
MAGTSLYDWFRRRSPSRWIADVLKVTPAELRRTVDTTQHRRLGYRREARTI